jgi:hypothetical protein
MMTELRLCKDCKHYKRDWNARITGFGDTFDLCLHPALTGNVVTDDLQREEEIFLKALKEYKEKKTQEPTDKTTNTLPAVIAAVL